jgi:hypothetical protein
VFGTSTSTNGPGSNSLTTTPITIDRTAPTISSVSAPANQLYIPGNSISFTLNMAETVTVKVVTHTRSHVVLFPAEQINQP